MGSFAVLRGVALQVLGLQRLHVVLVDLQRGAQLYRQSSEDVITCHQQQRLAIDFLSVEWGNVLIDTLLAWFQPPCSL